MTIDTEDLLNSIMASFDRIGHINSADIPNIDLYMDQVLTFMDSRLRRTTRDPESDKIMTKTMINNYAKNDMLPPPVKKKYSKEHVLLLIFIFYYKNVLSITDIQTLLRPITEKYFGGGKSLNLEKIYDEVFSLQEKQVEQLKADVLNQYGWAETTFAQEKGQEQSFLRMFAFVCTLSFDVYVKKLLIEKVIDSFAKEPEKKDSQKSGGNGGSGNKKSGGNSNKEKK